MVSSFPLSNVLVLRSLSGSYSFLMFLRSTLFVCSDKSQT